MRLASSASTIVVYASKVNVAFREPLGKNHSLAAHASPRHHEGQVCGVRRAGDAVHDARHDADVVWTESTLAERSNRSRAPRRELGRGARDGRVARSTVVRLAPAGG